MYHGCQVPGPHQDDPIVGSALAATLSFLFVLTATLSFRDRPITRNLYVI